MGIITRFKGINTGLRGISTGFSGINIGYLGHVVFPDGGRGHLQLFMIASSQIDCLYFQKVIVLCRFILSESDRLHEQF